MTSTKTTGTGNKNRRESRLSTGFTMIATGRMEERVSVHEIGVVFIRLQSNSQSVFIPKFICFHLCIFLGRQIKVQFCTDPLSEVIHYETER